MKRLFALALLMALVLLSGCVKQVIDPIIEPPAIVNNSPQIHPPFTTATSFDRGNTVVFDVRFRYHGCDNGMVRSVSGARDIDGDPLEYRFACDWSVYADLGDGFECINDRWITFPIDDRGEQKALVVMTVGWTGTDPYFPYAPMDCTLPDPVIPPDHGGGCNPGVGQWSFEYSVRDPDGATATHATVYGAD